ncbi:MAG: hypothetical protein HY047_08730 [Acidobacteria bacterium]|nr:hypothetical protein [Acidobacteriota bacterium]
MTPTRCLKRRRGLISYRYKVGFEINYQEKQRELGVGGRVVTGEDLAAAHRELQFSEIGPRSRGLLQPAAFWWSAPIHQNVAHFNIGVTHRNGNAYEEVEIVRIGKGWSYALRLTDADTGRILIACRDNGIPQVGTFVGISRLCIPDIAHHD